MKTLPLRDDPAKREPALPGPAAAPLATCASTATAAGPETATLVDRTVFAVAAAAEAVAAARRQSAALPRRGPFGRYILLEELGRGGMGVVYKATRKDLNATFAVKVLLAGDQASPEVLRRFELEAQVAARLRHPGIVPVVDLGVEEGQAYYAMEFVDGVGLERLLDDPTRAGLQPLEGGADEVQATAGRSLPATTRRRRGLRVRDAVRISAEVAEAVDYAHRQGVVHRDLKPANVLLDREGRARVLDFGLAKLLRPQNAGAVNATSLTRTGAVIGTLAYMPPEQAGGATGDIDARSDVYSLGALLYELATGRRPFCGENEAEVLARVLLQEPDAPCRVNPALPRDVETIIQKAMEKAQERRYATARALAEDLRRYLDGDPIQAQPPSALRIARRWARRHPATAAGAAVAATVFTLVALREATRPGELSVKVDVPGAWVKIDGLACEKAVRVRAGRHDVRAGADGYEEEARELDVARGERRTAEFNLRRSTGTVSLLCENEGAVVEILGEAHGTPVRRHALPVGGYRLRVRKRGHESREVALAVRRGEESAAWVSLPPSRAWYRPIADAGAAYIWLRDANGDGIRDVTMGYYDQLLTFDGRTGADLARLELGASAHGPGLRVLDVDGDGTEDQVLTRNGRRPGRVEGVLVVQAIGGMPTGTGPQAPGQKAPGIRLLWERSLPAENPDAAPPEALPVGAELWVRVPGGVERLEAGTGRSLGTLRIEGALATLERITESEDVLAAAVDGALVRFGPDGSERWRSVGVEGGATLALVSPPAGVAVLLGTSAAFALRLSDGARAWETEFPIGTTGHFVSPPTESDPGAIGLGTKEAFVCLDPTTGRERFRLPAAVAGADAGAAPEEPAFEPALSAPGLFLGASNRRLLARSTRTGERLWTRELSDAPACPPVWRSGPLGLELYVATNDARLVQFDSAGREVREVLLHAAPFAIHADDLDADGRTDLILSGNGIQCIPSTRVLWRRSLTNAVRPRPRVLDLGGRKGVILPGKWDRDRSDLRCLDGATGAELWRSGGGFDTIFEPELRDMDGDGVLDVVLHTQAAPSGIVCVSGRDGRELSRFARCPICYAAPLFQDVDGDGKAEALVCVWGGGLQAWLPGAAEPLWSVPAAAVMTRPALGDLDGDGRPEVLLAFPGSGDKTGRAIAVDLAGRVRWSFDAPEYMRTTPAALDLDGDGAPEVLVAGARDLFVLGRDGRERARWPGMGGSLYAPTVVDADGDGRPELLLGTTRGVALLRRDGSAVWTYAAACVGGALEVAKLPCASGPAVVGIDGRGRFFVLELRTGREVWRWESGAACEGGVTLGDVDGDGVPEAFFGSHDQGLYAIDLR